MIECGATSSFINTWVFIKKSPDDFDEDAMKNFHKIMFASSFEECCNHFPKHDGVLCNKSLDSLRELMSKYTIVGKRPELSGGGLIDIGRTGMVKGLTEQTEYILSLSGVEL